MLFRAKRRNQFDVGRRAQTLELVRSNLIPDVDVKDGLAVTDMSIQDRNACKRAE